VMSLGRLGPSRKYGVPHFGVRFGNRVSAAPLAADVESGVMRLHAVIELSSLQAGIDAAAMYVPCSHQVGT
jgi:hypothetical protein